MKNVLLILTAIFSFGLNAKTNVVDIKGKINSKESIKVDFYKKRDGVYWYQRTQEVRKKYAFRFMSGDEYKLIFSGKGKRKTMYVNHFTRTIKANVDIDFVNGKNINIKQTTSGFKVVNN